MYYLKYRPQTIDEIDTSVIRDNLKKILSKPEPSHAWLLTGPKGTGKTSTARIIAKAINCEKNRFAKKGETIEPCNICKNCTAITSGFAVDVIEMDAASNRKIDDIRQLIDNIKFSPAHMRFKVYIIDEVHMLTTEAFNALLKTLEEPPLHAILILATTELDKLPKTVVSRCMRLAFSKASIGDVHRQLERIVKGEKLNLDDNILTFIARNCDSSFRDAAKLLEDVITYEISTIDSLRKHIGLSSDNSLLMEILETGKIEAALAFVEDFDQKGGSFKALIEALLDKLHQALLARHGIAGAEASKLTVKQISQLIKLLTESYNLLKISPIEALPLEIALVDYFAEKQ